MSPSAGRCNYWGAETGVVGSVSWNDKFGTNDTSWYSGYTVYGEAVDLD